MNRKNSQGRNDAQSSQLIRPEVLDQRYSNSNNSQYMGNKHQQQGETGGCDARLALTVHRPVQHTTGDYDGRTEADVYPQQGYDARSWAHDHQHLGRHDGRHPASHYMPTERPTSERFSELSGDIIQQLEEAENLRANEAKAWFNEKNKLSEQIKSLENEKEK